MSLAIWTQLADADLEGIYLTIARDGNGPNVAKNVYRKLVAHCEEYAKSFQAGHVVGTAREDLGEDCRVFTHQRWVVVFRPLAEAIEVLRVLDGSRDYAKLFQLRHGE